jgi:hypothetical protein
MVRESHLEGTDRVAIQILRRHCHESARPREATVLGAQASTCNGRTTGNCDGRWR